MQYTIRQRHHLECNSLRHAEPMKTESFIKIRGPTCEACMAEPWRRLGFFVKGAPACRKAHKFTTFTIRYDTRCYFNVRSKADMNRLNLPHGDDN